LSGKAKATIGRHHSDAAEHSELSERFVSVDVVEALGNASGLLYVTAARVDPRATALTFDGTRRNAASSGINSDVVMLSQRFTLLVGRQNRAISDGRISLNEAKRLLRETLSSQQILPEMKLGTEFGTRH
tara:strand:- start:71 stop:460 length:390 start_codon:yes stop_codon:yes gene_type:complete